MGKAGQALRQVLQSYNISHSLLAQGLGVEHPIVLRWVHEHTDPTAQTVIDIIQALHQINLSAATDFVQAYLGNSTQTLQIASTHELPRSDRINVSALSQIFDKTTNSYKYLFFMSLLDIIKRRKFENSSSISFKEIIVEMLANAWYPHKYFKLALGTQDQIANKLDSLALVITEPILKFRDPDKKLLRKSIQSQNLDDIINFISRYVPFRLIRPFFAQKTRDLSDTKVNQSIVELAKNEFEVTKPIYCFDSDSLKNCKSIIFHQDWLEYIAENYLIVRGWLSWEWLKYMQQCNPNVPAVANKLFPPQERGSLNNQKSYWKLILKQTNLQCIYTKRTLPSSGFSLDHYLPWSFVAHDQPWNLIPTFPEVNSSKSNNIPADDYFEEFVKLQHLGLCVSKKIMEGPQWTNYVEPYMADLKIADHNDLHCLKILELTYESTFKPLLSIAIRQGFTRWSYR